MASSKSSIKASDKEEQTEQFDWIQLSNDVQGTKHEGFSDKFIRKVMENPFVPLGKRYLNGEAKISGSVWMYRLRETNFKFGVFLEFLQTMEKYQICLTVKIDNLLSLIIFQYEESQTSNLSPEWFNFISNLSLITVNWQNFRSNHVLWLL